MKMSFYQIKLKFNYLFVIYIFLKYVRGKIYYSIGHKKCQNTYKICGDKIFCSVIKMLFLVEISHFSVVENLDIIWTESILLLNLTYEILFYVQNPIFPYASSKIHKFYETNRFT